MKNARTGQLIIPQIFGSSKFVYIAEKVWNGSSWIKIDYYSLLFAFQLISPPVSLRDSVEFKITIDNNLIA